MKFLELKIPPVFLIVLCGFVMWIIAGIFPDINLSVSIRYSGLLALFLSGFVIALSGAVSFKKAATTVNPINPEKTSSLITSGIYRFTRNPMYVGFALSLTGWGIFLANLYSLSLIVVFMLYMNRFQIIPEERALESLFDEEYLAYKSCVRRWL